MPPNIIENTCDCWDDSSSAVITDEENHHHLIGGRVRLKNDSADFSTTVLKTTTSTDKLDNNTTSSSSSSSSSSDDDNKEGRRLWKKILHQKDDAGTVIESEDEEECNNSDLFTALSRIRILKDGLDDDENKEWLDRFHGRLSDISTGLLQTLRNNAPDVDSMSTVADFNDNLLYHMMRGNNSSSTEGEEVPAVKRQQKEEVNKNNSNNSAENNGGLTIEQVQELKGILRSDEYIGSYLTTKNSTQQPPHVDFAWDILEQFCSCKDDDNDDDDSQGLMIGFFPLTKEGMFLQIWPTRNDSKTKDRNDDDINQDDNTATDDDGFVEGEIIFIPYTKLLMVPANTIHGGGFRTTPYEEEPGRRGNLRFHLYIAPTANNKHDNNGGQRRRLPAHQQNKYTEPNDKTKELSRRYVDSKHMQTLIRDFFV